MGYIYTKNIGGNMADIWESIGRNFIKWALGIIAACLIALIGGGVTWFITWSNDEAAEDAEKRYEKTLMFDDPNQKEEHKDHVKEAIPPLEQRLKIERDIEFQQDIKEAIKRQDCLMIRLNDQYYQLKEELRREHGIN